MQILTLAKMNVIITKTFQFIKQIRIPDIIIKKSQVFEFRQFKNLYEGYQMEVISNQMRYDRFVSRYISKHQMISVSINSAGYPDKYEYDRKNLNFEKIYELLINRIDLVELYFSKNQFEYSDFEKLVNDIDTTYAPTAPTIEVEEKLGEEKTQQQELLKKEVEITEETSNMNIATKEKSEEEKQIELKNIILKFQSGEEKPKHFGHRLFGLWLTNQSKKFNDEQRLNHWYTFTGLKEGTNKPELHYLRKPYSNKNGIPPEKFNIQLTEIQSILDVIEPNYLGASEYLKTS